MFKLNLCYIWRVTIRNATNDFFSYWNILIILINYVYKIKCNGSSDFLEYVVLFGFECFQNTDELHSILSLNAPELLLSQIAHAVHAI